MDPIICFGQQPCGFFPKRFLVAKIETARKLQKEIGGKIVFFYHDSDADYRETITIFNDSATGAEVRLNFIQENKLQKKFSPLYLKRIPAGWKQEILKQLPRFADKSVINLFSSVDGKTAGDFCLQMYSKMGLLEGIEIVKSSDKNFRQQASDLDKDLSRPAFRGKIEAPSKNNSFDKNLSADGNQQKVERGYFADVEYMGEIVRAQIIDGKLQLHEGGGKYTVLPDIKLEKWQKNAARDARFKWMNSVIRCTHYIYGEGEKEYLKTADFPEVKFVDREKIDNPNFAWIPNL